MGARITRRRFLQVGAAAGGLAGLGTLGCQLGARRKAATVREVQRAVAAVASRDGAGVALHRALGSRELPLLDPFLLLDEIHSDQQEDWVRGFPSHPHRGFETVSYLIAGAFEHRDSVGNHGRIGAGATQWMTAGRGIIHSEMPRQEPGKDLWGLQLWVNLPAANKMTRPRYQDIDAPAIPELDVGDARVRVVAGTIRRAKGPVDGIVTEPMMIDVDLPSGGRFREPVPGGHTVFAYVLDGEVAFGERATVVAAGSSAVLAAGDELAAASGPGGRFLLFAGAPIGEPVARRGPFVMNTEAELRQAFDDYRSGRLTDG